MRAASPSFLSSRRVQAIGGLTVLAALGAAALVFRENESDAPVEIDFAAVTIEAVAIRDNVFVLYAHGAGEFSAGNITAYVSPDGVVLVDTQFEQIGDKNLAAIRSFTDEPIAQIISTHFHVDHVGGNEYFRLRANADELAEGGATGREASVLAHSNVVERLRRPLAEGGRRMAVWPTETYASAETVVRAGGELVRVLHEPYAHTDGDSFVQFVTADVISAGDVYHSERYPFIDRANGGSFAGVLAALDALVDLAEQSGAVAGATLVVPGHGRVASEADVAEYRDMLRRIGARVRALVDMDLTVPQVVAAQPSAEYDARFGVTTGFWRTGDFVAAVAAEMREAREP